MSSVSKNIRCITQVGQLYARKNTAPMIVVGSTDEALAAAMALCARDVLQENNSQNELKKRRSTIPPAQQVAFYNKQEKQTTSLYNQPQQKLSSETVSSLQNALLFLGPTSLDSYEQILANSLQLMSRISQNNNDNGNGDDSMLYTSIDFGHDDGLKSMESLSLVRNRFSFLGLNLCTNHIEQDDNNNEIAMSRESADTWGNELSALLIGRQPWPPPSDVTSATSSTEAVLRAAVTMDIQTHLAMLQANSLPKTNGVLGDTNDVWAVRGTMRDELLIDNIRDGMLLEYNFDYNDPFGGCDPLVRPSMGYIVASSATNAKVNAQSMEKANDAYAAAYSTMVGSGLDPLSSICIATSIRAVFIEYGSSQQDKGMFCPPSYTWKIIDKIAEYTLQCTNNIRKEDGYPRKIYKEFGYR